MKLLLITLLFLATRAHANLGGKASDSSQDLPKMANRKTSVYSGSLSCYSVQQITADGVSEKQYINKTTDTVFMIRLNSRIPLAIQPLMNATDFEEYRQAGPTNANHSTPVVRHLSRNLRRVNAETSRLKISVEDRSTNHRSILILKTDVPTCVTNPEELP